jgi:hypothetical protein
MKIGSNKNRMRGSFMKPSELIKILQVMSKEDDDIPVRLEDRNGNVYELKEICLFDDDERYEIALRAISTREEIEIEIELDKKNKTALPTK